jgi:hypothetical protein
MQPSNKHLLLEECSSFLHGAIEGLFSVGDCCGGLHHVIWFAGQEPLEGFHVLGEVGEDCFSRFWHQILEVGTDRFGRIFLLEGPEEAGFDRVPAGFVNPEGLQFVPPRLGGASEDAGQFLNFAAVIPGSNFCSSLNSVNK